MRFTVERQEALRAFRLAKQATGVRCTLPILANVLVEADQEKQTVALTGYDMQSGLRLSMAAEVQDPGATTLAAWQAVDLLAALKVDAITFAATNETAQIGPASLGTLPAEEYPVIPPLTGKPCLTIRADRLADALARVAPFASKDPTRGIVQGVLLEVKGRRLIVSATDSFRLARLPVSGEGQRGRKGSATAILPAECATQLAKMIGKAKGLAEVRIGDLQINVTWQSPVGRFAFSSRLIEGRFPACKGIWRSLGATEGAVVSVDSDQLTAEVTAAHGVAKLDADKILLTFAGSALKLTAAAEGGHYESLLGANVHFGRHYLDPDGDGWYAVQAGYLLSTLKFLGPGEVRWHFPYSETHPFAFTSPHRPGAIVAVSPMRL
jgi:DNA polymerase-3 subunit beta